jgi:hypothetical protein
MVALETTWKKPRNTVKKMEWNHNRPPGLILDDYDGDDDDDDDDYLQCFI